MEAEATAISAAAELIADADALLITAGAGMGVDSGLPDFRGAEGFWRAYPALGRRGLRLGIGCIRIGSRCLLRGHTHRIGACTANAASSRLAQLLGTKGLGRRAAAAIGGCIRHTVGCIHFLCHDTALRKVSTTGRRSTSRNPHQPAASASTAPTRAPHTGTHSDTVHSNSNT